MRTAHSGWYACGAGLCKQLLDIRSRLEPAMPLTAMCPLWQATSGGGGWPMSVFLTPDLQPFLGGTYFPPADAYGRPGRIKARTSCMHACTQLLSLGLWHHHHFVSADHCSLSVLLLAKARKMCSAQQP